MSTNNSPVIYGLICGHAAPGPPTLVNGTRYCAWHQCEQEITTVIEYEWRANCLTCTYARWAGLSKQNAKIFLDGHLRRSNDHQGQTEYIRNPEAVKTAEKMAAWQGRKAG